jgi:hypothetical protein
MQNKIKLHLVTFKLFHRACFNNNQLFYWAKIKLLQNCWSQKNWNILCWYPYDERIFELVCYKNHFQQSLVLQTDVLTIYCISLIKTVFDYNIGINTIKTKKKNSFLQKFILIIILK